MPRTERCGAFLFARRITTVLLVGAGLLAKAVCQLMHVLTDTPPSRASPLPHLDWGTFSRQKKRPEPVGAFLLPIDQTTINGDDRLHRERGRGPLLLGKRRGWQRSSLGSSGAGQPEGGYRQQSRHRRPDRGW